MQWNLKDESEQLVITSWDHRLELVVLGEAAVHNEVERAHGGHGPEEIVEVSLIEVVADPPGTVRRGRERRHDGVDERAQVAPYSDGDEQRQWRARGLSGCSEQSCEQESELSKIAILLDDFFSDTFIFLHTHFF